jgi:hypothetical protein
MTMHAEETFYERHAVTCFVIVVVLSAIAFVAPHVQPLLRWEF